MLYYKQGRDVGSLHVPSKGAWMGGQGPTGRCCVYRSFGWGVNLLRETCQMGKLVAKIRLTIS